MFFHQDLLPQYKTSQQEQPVGMASRKVDPWTIFHREVRLSFVQIFNSDLVFLVANVLVGNDPGVEVLEMTLTGPELLFTAPAVFSVCGAPVLVTVDGKEKPMWSRLTIQAGQKMKIGKVEDGGLRIYLAVKGGFPEM